MLELKKESIELAIHISENNEVVNPNQSFSIVIKNNKGFSYSIDHNAFAASYGLQSVTLPAGLTAINDTAFEKCCNLRTITFKNILPPEINGELVFDDVPLDCQIIIPAVADKHLWLTTFLRAEFHIKEENIIFAE